MTGRIRHQTFAVLADLEEATLKYFLCYDIGGTKIEAGLFGFSPERNQDDALPIGLQSGWITEIQRLRQPTERRKGYEQILAKMVELAHVLTAPLAGGTSALTGLGMTLPGTVDPHTKTMRLGNALVLRGRAVAEDLCRALQIDLPYEVDNDANLFAWAEHWSGAGRAFAQEHGFALQTLIGVGIILGTGCGTGVVDRRHLIHGARGAAGEFGHLILHSGGYPCYCGRDGCAEQYLSGPALEAAFAMRRYQQVSEVQNAADIFAAAEAEDPIACAVVQKYTRDLAQFLGMIATAVDPHYFVLGGGLSRQQSLYAGLDRTLANSSFLGEAIPVYSPQLGDSAGIIGAALAIIDRVIGLAEISQ